MSSSSLLKVPSFLIRRPTVAQLVREYLDHCRTYYRRLDGSPTGTADQIQAVLSYFTADYGQLRTSEFTPLKLKEFQRKLIATGLARTTINSYVGEVKKLFQFGVSEEKVDPWTHHALTTVKNLKRGRCGAREGRGVEPVHEKDIVALEPYLSGNFWSLICLQLVAGARSGEVDKLRGMDINQQGDVWTAELEQHKNAHRDKARILFFGARAQAILQPMLVRALPTDYLFSPNCGLNPYKPGAYRAAVHRACRLAGVERWTPHQLRHTSATMVRKRFGLQPAQVYLGHASLKATQIYAEADRDLAYKIAKEIG